MRAFKNYVARFAGFGIFLQGTHSSRCGLPYIASFAGWFLVLTSQSTRPYLGKRQSVGHVILR